MRLCCKVLPVLVVAVLAVVCDGLQKDDEGVCLMSLYSMVRIPDCTPTAIPRKRCEKFQYIERPICCGGWEYDIHLDKCNPISVSGFATNATYIRKQPRICDPDCNNARCIDTDTCECLPGFHTLNNTHCIPICEIGYINDPYDCSPVCNTPCVNANCTAPDTCTCLSGYIKDNIDGNNCVPQCDFACANGVCFKPNECTCSDGYRQDPIDRFNCLQISDPDCVNNYCISPNLDTTRALSKGFTLNVVNKYLLIGLVLGLWV